MSCMHTNIYMQEPKEIQIGETHYIPKFSGAKHQLVEKTDTYHYVPLLSSLKRLLQDKSVVKEIDTCKSRVRTNGYVEDFCDGSLFYNHPLFSKDDCALQIIALYDEAELCNPLESHVKRHKLGVVFYTLSNISPKYRSSLRMINLAVIATVPVVE